MNKGFLLFAISFLSATSFAQQRTDTILPGQRIDIIQTYKPEVTLPEKPKLNPSAPNIVPSAPTFTYNVPVEPLSFSYQPAPLKPLALGKEADPKSLENYVAAAFGNFATVNLDAAFTTAKEGKYSALAHVYHLSQQGGKIENRRSALTDVFLQGTYRFTDNEVWGRAGYRRRGQSLYGYDHDALNLTDPQVQQTYNKFYVGAGFTNVRPFLGKITYRPDLELSITTALKGGSERNLRFKAPISFQFTEESELGIEVDVNLVDLVLASKSSGARYGMLSPYYRFHSDNIFLELGLGLLARNQEQRVGLIPNAKLRIQTNNARLAFVVGVDGGVEQYTLDRLSEKNPFINSLTTITNGVNRKAFGGLELALSPRLKVEGNVSINHWTQYAMFTNDYLPASQGRYFNVNYVKDVTALMIYAATSFRVSDAFEVGGNSLFTTFNKDNGTIYHEPNIDLKAFLRFRPIAPLQLTSIVQFLDGIDYINPFAETKKLPAIVNLNFGANYQIAKRFDIFLHLDNVLNNRFERWHQYNAYGFNIFGGLKVKF